MQKPHFFSFWFLALLLLALPAKAQFKRSYGPDSLGFNPSSLFRITKVVETNLPGRRIALFGNFSGSSSSGQFYQSIFQINTDLQGNQISNFIYEDTSAFVLQGPISFSACYDGSGHYYVGMGANGKQVILKTDTAGTADWAFAGNHHEYYSVICEQNGITFLGQDESTQGAHDYSFARLDSNGLNPVGAMFGTPDFELPAKILKHGTQYVAAGGTYYSNAMHLSMVKSNGNFEKIWGWVYESPGKALYASDLKTALDGSGYFVTGRANSTADSVFVVKLDTAGGFIWGKTYSIGNYTAIQQMATAQTPDGDLLICGSYQGSSYQRPYVMCVDSSGTFRWLRDYGMARDSVDEVFYDIIYNSIDEFFYAAGEQADAQAGFARKAILVKADPSDGAIPCDSVLNSGQGSLVLSQARTMHEEPFLASTPYPIASRGSISLQQNVQCSVMVAIAEPRIAPANLRIVNPSNGKLRYLADLAVEDGMLIVHDLQGRILYQQNLAVGLHKGEVDLPELADGMYLVRLQSGDWSSKALRWLVLRP